MEKIWKKIRKPGKNGFILIYAVLFGSLLSIFCTIIIMILRDNYNWEDYTWNLLGIFIGGFLGGLPGGLAQWELHKRKYNDK
jgi:formate/nitrite transporter FocA (FNT family)